MPLDFLGTGPTDGEVGQCQISTSIFTIQLPKLLRSQTESTEGAEARPREMNSGARRPPITDGPVASTSRPSTGSRRVVKDPVTLNLELTLVRRASDSCGSYCRSLAQAMPPGFVVQRRRTRPQRAP